LRQLECIRSSRPGTLTPEVCLVVASRYHLQEKIGEAALDEVWLARQSEPVKRDVALKLIKDGANSRQVLAHFEAERQALAPMDHPNIAKVLDGGVTKDGRSCTAAMLMLRETSREKCRFHLHGPTYPYRAM
jgi:serine/threonine protein kinase